MKNLAYIKIYLVLDLYVDQDDFWLNRQKRDCKMMRLNLKKSINKFYFSLQRKSIMVSEFVL